MECKDIHFYCLVSRYRIRIYPEWNVKKKGDFALKVFNEIRIYPEWNVKGYTAVAQPKKLKLEYIQNGM